MSKLSGDFTVTRQSHLPLVEHDPPAVRDAGRGDFISPGTGMSEMDTDLTPESGEAISPLWIRWYQRVFAHNKA
jgi:hypothetical protein